MRKLTSLATTLLLVFCFASPCFSQTSATPAPNEFLVGPITLTNDVQGVPVQVQMTAFFSAVTTPSGITIQARILADLSDLQGKFGTIVDKQDLPRNNCRSYSANNPVVTVDRKRIDLDGNKAVVLIAGEVDVWDCRENPAKCSKVEWRNDGFLGTPSPTVVWWDCYSPFKNKLLTQPITMTIPVTIDKASDTAVRINLGKPNVELGGNPILSSIRDFILDLFRFDINNIADSKIRSSIDPSKFILALPPGFRQLNPRVDQVSFGNVSGHLGILLNLSASAKPSDLTDFLKLVVDNKKPT